MLYRVVQEHLETFLSQAREQSDGVGMPRFIEREFRRYLQCGILAYGFARVKCTECKNELLVAFSCKGRGLCPSCTTRRMHDLAAHLIDRVLPRVPYRQWVLSVPFRIRYLLAVDARLLSRVLAIFLRAISAHLRAKAKRLGIPKGTLGAITFVQRFGGSLNPNMHFHCVLADGLFASGTTARFWKVVAPTDEEVTAVARRSLAVCFG